MFKKLKAFTLAEALIVIVVIGVISMLTIPVYKKNFEKKGFEAALKKNYSILRTAFEQYEIDNYRPILPTQTFSKDFGLKKALMPYLNVYYECKEGEDGEGVCASPDGYSSMLDEHNYSGGTYMNNHGQFVLNDGTLIMLGSKYEMHMYHTIQFIYIDVNGYKRGPNKMGIDTFVFEIMSNGELLPVGAKGTFKSGACNEKNGAGWYNGYNCTYEIISKRR